MKSDYLKYWRVIRFFIMRKYKLNQADLDMLLFLYSESYFSRDRFDEYTKMMSWDHARFNRLLKEGWIVMFRENKGKRRALYELSYKCKRMINSIYKKLDGEEIPETTGGSNLFYKNVSYSDKRYRDMIIAMNQEVKQKNKGFIEQQQHPSP
jgi:hypothetical protein